MGSSAARSTARSHSHHIPPPIHLVQYNLAFYLTYLARWPALCLAAVTRGGAVAGYILGKQEGKGKKWHGHVTAVAVAPAFRRTGLASALVAALEAASDADGCYFVDLFVRASNEAALKLYARLGYTVYRRVLGYYSGEEDALDMRRALSADPGGESVVPLARPVRPAELEWD
jgi:N-terminal acetyltransferase B complex catalytic subunit